MKYSRPGEARTLDQRIKSPLLYQLSYRPAKRAIILASVNCRQELVFSSGELKALSREMVIYLASWMRNLAYILSRDRQPLDRLVRCQIVP